MTKEIMRRKAADNIYLHKDFHSALNIGLEYVRRRFGKNAVKDYLRQFAKVFYAPLARQMKRRGLAPLKNHLKHIYKLEGGKIRLTGTKDELRLESEFCPAVRHIRRKGFKVSPLFIETERTVYGAICEGTPFSYELMIYDPKTGKSVQRFYRRKP
jgi:hypothetical protein